MDLSKIFLKRINAIGLDISDTAVRAVRLKGKKGKFRLKSLATTPLPPGIVIYGVVKEREKLVQYLRKLRRKIRARKPFAIVTVSDHMIFYTTMQTPRLTADQTREFLSLNAPDNLPYPKAEAFFGFETISESVTANTAEIVLASIRSTDFYSLEKTVKAAGFEILAVEPQSSSLSHLLSAQNLTGVFVILDVKMEDSVISIYQNGHIVFTSVVSGGLKSLVDASAMQVPANGTINPDTEKIISSFYSALASETNRILRFRNIKPSKIYLSSELQLPKPAEYLNRDLKLEVEDFSAIYGLLKIKNLSFGTLPALGAAVRGLGDPIQDKSLTLTAETVPEFIDRTKKSLVYSGLTRFLIVSLLSIIFCIVVNYLTLLYIKRSFEVKLASIHVSSGDEQLIKKARSFNSLLGSAESILSKQYSWDIPIKTIRDAAVDGTYYTGISIVPTGEIVLRGQALKRDNLLRLQKSLRDTKLFSDVNFAPEDLQQPENISFTISMKLNLEMIKRPF